MKRTTGRGEILCCSSSSSFFRVFVLRSGRNSGGVVAVSFQRFPALLELQTFRTKGQKNCMYRTCTAWNIRLPFFSFRFVSIVAQYTTIPYHQTRFIFWFCTSTSKSIVPRSVRFLYELYVWTNVQNMRGGEETQLLTNRNHTSPYWISFHYCVFYSCVVF